MLGLPINASAHGQEIDFLILLIHLMMLILFIGWGCFFVIALVRFRKSRHLKANYTGVKTHFSSVVEVVIVILEAVFLIGFSIPFWARQVNAFPNRTDSVEVRVIAEQFVWNVHYPGPDGIFGRMAISLIDKQSNPIGLDSSDPHAKDDFVTINQLHLPIGRPAVIHLTSKDVIHCFALPVMRVKQDIIPGMSIPVWFTPTKTGNFEIACAQLCGLGHYRMKGYLVINSEEDYAKWVEDQRAAAQTSYDESTDDFWN